MPRLFLQAFIPEKVDQVWEHVTGCTATGRIDRRALRKKYGALIAQDGESYTFRESLAGEDQSIIWRCDFERPIRRVIGAEGRSWSDRYDYFEPVAGGTWWTIEWVPKARGLRSYTIWLGFRFRSRTQVFQQTIQPLLDHFQPGIDLEAPGA